MKLLADPVVARTVRASSACFPWRIRKGHGSKLLTPKICWSFRSWKSPADNAFVVTVLPKTGVTANWDCDMWSGFGTNFSYIQTGAGCPVQRPCQWRSSIMSNVTITHWLVVTGTMEFDEFPFSWEFHHPNWLSLHHFSEGLVETTN